MNIETKFSFNQEVWGVYWQNPSWKITDKAIVTSISIQIHDTGYWSTHARKITYAIHFKEPMNIVPPGAPNGTLARIVPWESFVEEFIFASKDEALKFCEYKTEKDALNS